MTTTSINSLSDFDKVISDHSNSRVIYRGESSLKYELRTSFGRDQFTSAKNTAGIEKKYFEEFKRKAEPYLEYEPKNDLEWLAIAQHHGLHTRLLDWTSNPLVGLYFSVKNRNYEDSVLYILDQAKINEPSSSIDPFSINEVSLYYPKHIARRIIAQSGLFTIHPDPVAIFTDPALEKIIVKKECRNELYVRLDTYNINEFSLFPDLQGLSFSLTQRWVRG